jgi:acyl-CoA thioesterase YciA
MPSVTLTKIVMPGQANTRGTIFGGALLSMMDEAAAIVAIRHAHASVVTAHFESVDFRAPIHLGEAAEVTATLASTGRTSMKIAVEVYGENLASGERRHCTTAQVVMVAMGPDGHPTPVPPLRDA